MPHARVVACLIGLGSMVAVGSWAPHVMACSPPQPGWRGSLETRQVPANGFVMFSYSCRAACDPALEQPVLTVRDAVTGTEIPGEVREIPEAYLVFGWRATSPLPPGQYRIDLQTQTPSAPFTDTFEAVAPESLGLETLTVSEMIDGVDLQEGEQVCCPGGPLDSCSGHHCYWPRMRRKVSIAIEWTTKSAPAPWGQYLHRVTWDGAPAPDSWRWRADGFIGGSFDTAQAEYCYTLELKSLIDGSIERFDRTCLAHPAGLEIGPYDRDPAEVQGDLGRCDEPPAGLETAWCKARTDYCASYYPLEQCPRLTRLTDLCKAPGSGGAAGAGGAPVVVPKSKSDSDEGGCSIKSSAARRPSAIDWAAALLALALGWRRKPRH